MARTEKEFKWAHILTGGASGALDAINGNNLIDLDTHIVMTQTGGFLYSLDDDSGASESSPSIIAPDVNAGTKRHLLQGLTFPNTGLKILETSGANTLTLKWNETDSADRVLSLLVGGGNRSLTLNESLTIGDGHDGTITFSAASKTVTVAGSCTLNDWFDQAVKTTSNVTFGTIGCGTVTTTGDYVLPSAGWLGLASDKGRLVFTDAATDTAVFTDCWVGVGTNPDMPLEVESGTTAKGIRITNTVVSPILDLYTTNANSDARNWRFRTNTFAFGDFSILRGTSQGAEPATNVLTIDKDGNIGIKTTSLLGDFQVHMNTNKNLIIHEQSSLVTIEAVNDAGDGLVDMQLRATEFNIMEGNVNIANELTVGDHGTAATDMVCNICYGTGAAPAANTTTIGSLFVKYVA